MRCEWAQLRARGSAWWRRRPASGTRVCKPKLIQRSIPFVYLYAYVMYPLNEQPQGINKPRNHLDIISGVGYNEYRVYSRNISKRRLTDNETSLQSQSFYYVSSQSLTPLSGSHVHIWNASNIFYSIITGGMLFILPRDSKYLPHLHVLWELRADIRLVASFS